MTSERLFNSFITAPPPKKKNFYTSKQIYGYALGCTAQWGGDSLSPHPNHHHFTLGACGASTFMSLALTPPPPIKISGYDTAMEHL